jgi:hypothetical protein
MHWGCPRRYPQGTQAVYVVFHVKLGGLWITSVDNFRCGVATTDGDVDLHAVEADPAQGVVSALAGN